MPRKEAEHRINHFIRVPQVRLVGDNVEVGVYPTQQAMKMAQDQALDLVEISPNADPPVCKIIDYNINKSIFIITIRNSFSWGWHYFI